MAYQEKPKERRIPREFKDIDVPMNCVVATIEVAGSEYGFREVDKRVELGYEVVAQTDRKVLMQMGKKQAAALVRKWQDVGNDRLKPKSPRDAETMAGTFLPTDPVDPRTLAGESGFLPKMDE